MNTLVVLNQPDTSFKPQRFDYVIGVDGGCRWCIDNGVAMDLAIGDFDSLDEYYVSQLTECANNIERHNIDKDFTDLELALNNVAPQHLHRLTVLGVWGGRIDHALANLLCLVHQTGNTPVHMPGRLQSGHLLKTGQSLIINHDIGQTVSILALLEDCTGVCTHGMKYPLAQARIKQGSARGLSNQTTTSPAWLRIDTGCLLVITDSHATAHVEVP